MLDLAITEFGGVLPLSIYDRVRGDLPAWNHRVLGGRGESAIPYLHLKDAVTFIQRVLYKLDDLEDGEILICSGDGATSHRELYAAAVNYWDENARGPVFAPRFLAKPGIRLLNLAGRFSRELPFERPWMADYVDMKLTVDSSSTRRRLGWAPRVRWARALWGKCVARRVSARRWGL